MFPVYRRDPGHMNTFSEAHPRYFAPINDLPGEAATFLNGALQVHECGRPGVSLPSCFDDQRWLRWWRLPWRRRGCLLLLGAHEEGLRLLLQPRRPVHTEITCTKMTTILAKSSAAFDTTPASSTCSTLRHRPPHPVEWCPRLRSNLFLQLR